MNSTKLLSFVGFRKVVQDYFNGVQPSEEAIQEIDKYLEQLQEEILTNADPVAAEEFRRVINLLRGEKIATP